MVAVAVFGGVGVLVGGMVADGAGLAVAVGITGGDDGSVEERVSVGAWSGESAAATGTSVVATTASWIMRPATLAARNKRSMAGGRV